MLYASSETMRGLYRAAATTAAGFSNLFMSGAERILSGQASMSREAVDEFTEAARQMDSADDLAELLSIQTRLLNAQVERSMMFFTDIYNGIGSGQREVLRVWPATMFDALNRLGQTLDGVRAPPGTEPVVSAMRRAAAEKPETDKEAGEQAAA